MKLNIKILLIFTVLMVMLSSLCAEKLKKDVNGYPIPFERYCTSVRDTIPAQNAAVYDSIAVPANAIAVTIIGTHQPLMIYTGTAKSYAAGDWVFYPKETPITIPVMDVITYIKYKSYTGANSIQLIWRRL